MIIRQMAMALTRGRRECTRVFGSRVSFKLCGVGGNNDTPRMMLTQNHPLKRRINIRLLKRPMKNGVKNLRTHIIIAKKCLRRSRVFLRQKRSKSFSCFSSALNFWFFCIKRKELRQYIRHCHYLPQ